MGHLAPGHPEDYSDARKLRLVASWFELKQLEEPEMFPSNMTSVQDDLRRMADRLEVLDGMGEEL